MKYHPLADAFPLLEGDDYEKLKADIELNGQRDAIVIMNGVILDGRNRHRACQELKIPHRERLYGSRPGDGDDPAAYVWSTNATRRHLTTSQLGYAAAKLANVNHGGDRKSEGFKGSSRTLEMVTREDAAARVGVSKSTVHRGKVVVTQTVPAVQDAVRDGTLPLTRAANAAKLPPDEQVRIMAEATATGRVASAFPADVRARSVAVAEVAGPGRGRIGPLVQLRRHLERNGIKEPVFLEEVWQENADVIPELPGDLLDDFIRDLKASRVAIKHLLDIIEEKTGKK